FLPLLEAGVIAADTLIADCKSGVSGAGRVAELSKIFPEVTDNFMAYGVTGHRHHPEIEQGLRHMARQPVQLTFTPHLVPMIRGIFATLYATLIDDSADVQMLFEQRYANEPFVDVLPAGRLPETRSVRASNMVRIAVARRPRGVTVLVVEDNLVKGAAGQAVQNMNLMFGLSETTGLTALPISP
ncbi:MAG: N-acetyl-gamma-glutamyl-phosphate reductase, partial [Burkholderiales bacterium]|nr:N-acetyl-gamma-glutamyl-phosphate reductase [Burkholderiales bacterium]